MLRIRTLWVVVLILLAGSLAAQTKGDAAMANNKVMAPDLRNPSPVRSAAEFPGQDFSYYCVR